MEALVDYIKPELLITAIALYFMGIALKEAQAVKDKYIPLILGVCRDPYMRNLCFCYLFL